MKTAYVCKKDLVLSDTKTVTAIAGKIYYFEKNDTLATMVFTDEQGDAHHMKDKMDQYFELVW